MGQVSEPEEQAATVFLASDAASDINGAVLPVDNGWTAVRAAPPGRPAPISRPR
ncbi:hypothetical protein [Streptomyces sp. Ag109_O5-10]|uniref:hypothetical protein n=1 Tax=Streptomyces sp. Ag109_O5-10 TaxID=1855349 RepID=UPI0015A5CFB4